MSNKIKEINKKMRSLQQSVDQISSLAKETKSMTYAVHDEVCYIDELCVAIRDLNTQIERLTDKVDLMYEAGKYTYPPSSDEIIEEMLRIVYNDPDIQF
ncbi:hypothetical protein SG0102_23050 [Intestinibaculum porci]|uniref:Uncharacterized protein n=1 Tax=Intestinibaculum porci TaxID=2487118 RepID=A0A3G9JMY3_9FIRM|nr:hypothetical protein [Intestinibaculum porci]BBH27371.1 hypothetical protein SG0102_23050 [Intestinibaculum porci]